MDTSRRLEQFDIAKALLIIIVVLGHAIYWVQEMGGTYNSIYIDNFIFTFHMPVFFIITGILFNDEKWKKISTKEFALKRIKTLIVPYLFFELFDSFVQLYMYKIGINSFVNCVINALTINCNVGADWFLIALFIGEIFYLINIKCLKKKLSILIQIACLLVPIILPNNHFCIVMGRSLIAYAMIMLGNELRTALKTKEIYNWKYIVLSVIITIIISLLNKDVNVVFCKVNNPVLFVLGSISGTYFILGISTKVRSKLLSFVGKNTLPILGVHQRILYLIPRYLPMEGNVIWIFIDVFVVFIVLIPFTLILNKFLPFLVGKKYATSQQ